MSNQKFGIQNLFNVQGWVVVVSGGGTGIGLMIAQAFANNGARVYILGRREEVPAKTAEVHGNNLLHPAGKIIPLACDVTDKDSSQKMAEEVGKREKKVDVLVNNSGISQGTSEVEKGDESAKTLRDTLWQEKVEEWENVYRTNVIGHFFTTVALLPLMEAAYKPGHTAAVINITSISGITRTTQHHFKYNISKGAAIHMSTLLAQELRRKGTKVRVNNIAPGIFPSEMTTNESDEHNKSAIESEGWGEQKGVPANRAGSDEDMAQTALMLAVNQYAYGQTLAIDGGYLLEHP